jgi:hypothetical protein
MGEAGTDSNRVSDLTSCRGSVDWSTIAAGNLRVLAVGVPEGLRRHGMRVRQLNTFLNLSVVNRHLLIQAAILVAWFRLITWAHPTPLVRRQLERDGPSLAADAHSRSSPAQIGWAVRAAGSHIPGGLNCLVQAWACRALLHRNGFEARLRIGVANPSGAGFRAHAWVESQDGVVVGAEGLDAYTILPDLP